MKLKKNYLSLFLLLLLNVSVAFAQEVDVEMDYNSVDSVFTIRIQNVFGSELALENISPFGGIESGSYLLVYWKDNSGEVFEESYELGPKSNWKKLLIPLKTDKEEIWIYNLANMWRYGLKLKSVELRLIMHPVLSDRTVDIKRRFVRYFEWTAK